DGTETYVMGMSKNASNLEAAKRENAVITMEKDYKQKYEGFDPKKPESMLGMTIMQEEFLENSIALAAKIQDNFVKLLGKKSRGGGVKQAPYMVLHKAYMPRVLIETGFVSNPVEGARLDSEEGQSEIAEAIYKAILSYKKDNFDGEDTASDNVKPSQRVEEVIVSTPVKKDSVVKKTEPKNVPVENEKPTKGVVFKIQISASAKKLETTPSNFKGLKSISMAQTPAGLYKYMYGETANYEEAKRLLAEAKSKGYNQAFIIAFKDGKSVSVQEALK
ncbi:MAG: N-acetylmuramoyl-L-alanine amidase family protein, partial [Flavobacterium stagni]